MTSVSLRPNPPSRPDLPLRVALLALLWATPIFPSERLDDGARQPFSAGQRFARLIGPLQTAPGGKTFCFTAGGEMLAYGFDGAVSEAPPACGRPGRSPDGRLVAMLEPTERGLTALRILDASTGATREIATFETSNHFLGSGATTAPAWSPSSRRIAFLASALATGAEGGETPRALVFDQPGIKAPTALDDGLRSAVFIADLETGQVERLAGEPAEDLHSLLWHPTGVQLLAVSQSPDRTSSDLVEIDLDGGARVLPLGATLHLEFAPTYSPSGEIAYLERRRTPASNDGIAESPRLMLWSPESRTTVELASNLDRRVRTVRFSADGSHIFGLVDDAGGTALFSTPTDEPAAARMVVAGGPHRVDGWALGPTGARLAYSLATPSGPGEVWLARADGSGARTLTRLNAEFERRVRVAQPEPLSFQGADGVEIQGWVMRPWDFAEGGRYPAVLCIHGGPHGAFGAPVDPFLQALAEAGLAVLFFNPRGSVGYGQRFADGTLHDWGGTDFDDLQRGVDAALLAHPWIDPERLAVMGVSYGGYMTNWAITHTDRFAAAAAIAGPSNLVSFYGTTMHRVLIDTEFGPVINYDALWNHSPIRYAARAATPTLFVHGAADNLVPPEQSEEMFFALQKRGIPSRLILYPGKGHGFGDPPHAIAAVIAWFGDHLGGLAPIDGAGDAEGRSR